MKSVSVVAIIILIGAPFASSFVPLLDSRPQRVLSSTTSLEAMTLFGSQGSRSPLVNWGALEMGLPLTMGNLMMNPHPFKQIPCLTDDEGVMVFESGAILQYVYSKSKAFETDSPKRRAAITSWISWANASLDPICFLETPEGKVYDTGMKNPNKRLFALDDILAKNEFLVEDGFSLADVAVASYLLYVPQFFQGIDLTRYPNIVRYMRQCAERPAYGEAFTPRVQSYLVSTLSAQEGPAAEGEEKKKFFGMF